MTQIFVVGIAGLLLAGCAARSYVPSESRQNLNSGISAVSVDLVNGRCEVTFAVKGDTGRWRLEAEDGLCAAARLAAGASRPTGAETTK